MDKLNIHEVAVALENNLLGVVHPVLFPGPGNTLSVMRGEGRKEYVLNSLKWIIDDPDFQTIEITRIKSPSIRKEAARLLKQAKEKERIKEIVYSAQLVQIYNEDQIVPPSDICSLDENDRAKSVLRLKECVDEALELHCGKFAFYSGKDPAVMSGLNGADADAARSQSLSQIRRSVHELCDYIREKCKKNQSLIPLMVVFDYRGNPPGCSSFKGALLGPPDRCESFVESVRHYYGDTDFGLMLDTSHILVSGGGPEVLKKLAPCLSHVHLSNCVLNRNTPDSELRYGDTHPAFNVPDSELTPNVLAGYLKALVESEYAGTISFEIRPIKSEVPEDVAAEAKAMFISCRNRIEVNYAITRSYKFQTRRFLTDDIWDRLSELRIQKTGMIRERMLKRKQRKVIAPKGKMVILAADHPARMVTNSGGDPVAMGNRFEYLGRCARVLMASSVDGIMATADVIEDLVLLDSLYQEKSGSSFMDDRVLIACMNRSGLAGARYEMLDRITAYRDAEKIKELKLDGAKLLMRLAVPDPYDRYCIQTMEECARGIEACNEIDLPVFLEPLPTRQIDGKYQVVMQADELIRVMGVASGLSHSSANLWLKIPYVEDYHRVAQAFSGPILMLGGESSGNPAGVIEQFVRGLGEGENVRGAMVGRNVLFPGDDDPAAVAEGVCAVVNNGVSANEAVKVIASKRGTNMDLLPKE